jgi:large subunit ribosomal protein L22
MEVKAITKFIRVSPKKARLVADLVRGKDINSAFATLRFMPKKSAGIILKTVKSAVANAENNFNLEKKDLVIKTITVNQGPSLKRFRPRSKGMASPLLKRTSHITVFVSDDNKQEPVKKEIKSEAKKIVKKLTAKKQEEK